MSMEVAFDLVLCGALLVGSSFLAQRLQPDLQRVTLFTGLAGGGLCVLWGVLGRRGTRCHGCAMVTLAAAACVCVRQAVQSWNASPAIESKGRIVAALMMVLVVFCVGMLANLAQEGKGPQP
jgi:peptidoglycan/LPS O-acetylase OafA/YrhL